MAFSLQKKKEKLKWKSSYIYKYSPEKYGINNLGFPLKKMSSRLLLLG